MDKGLGCLDIVFAQAQTSGYFKGIGLTRRSNPQTIGGTQGLQVKFHAGIGHAGSF